jgi:hypothetical protein
MTKTLPNVSILTIGEARGHNLFIDEQSLQQALAVAQAMGKIKVTNGHGATQVGDILGFVTNFKIVGNRLLGDLSLLDSEKATQVSDLAGIMPDQFGLSLTFSGVPEEREGRRLARVTEIYDVSVVLQPAANAALFSAFTRLPVDTFRQCMTKDNVRANLSAAAPVAAPEPPPSTALAHTDDHDCDKEPTLRDVISRLDTVLSLLQAKEKKDEELATAELAHTPEHTGDKAADKDEDEDDKEPTLRDIISKLNTLLGYMEDKKKDEEMATAPSAKNSELSRKIQMDSAGAAAVPAPQPDSKLSRLEILNQFNQEKSPVKRVALLRKLGV